MIDLNTISTKELVEELARRKGVEVIEAEPHEDKAMTISGPARLLIITD